MLDPGAAVEHSIEAGRHVWVQLVGGRVRTNDLLLEAGDGAAVSDETGLRIEALDAAELILFDLG